MSEVALTYICSGWNFALLRKEYILVLEMRSMDLRIGRVFPKIVRYWYRHYLSLFLGLSSLICKIVDYTNFASFLRDLKAQCNRERLFACASISEVRMKGNTQKRILIAVYEEAGRYSWSLINLMFETVFHVNTLLQKSVIIKTTAYGTKSALVCCYIDSGRTEEPGQTFSAPLHCTMGLIPSAWVAYRKAGESSLASSVSH